MGLSPRQVNKYIKSEFAGELKVSQPEDLKANKMREYRKIAPYRITARMGLEKLYAKEPEGFLDLGTDTVRIPVKQHIGAPAVPSVKLNEYVTKGQIIARLAEGSPSANVHASISGKVTECGAFISIKGGE